MHAYTNDIVFNINDVAQFLIHNFLLKKIVIFIELKYSFYVFQVSFSYSKGPRDEWNILKIDGFNMKDDPKR